jgi:hypothetical protein
MPKPLDYLRRLPSNAPSPLATPAIILSILATLCFLVPFVLLYAFKLLHRSPSPSGGITVAILVTITLILWLASGLLALCAAVLGIIVLRHEKARFSTLAATTICCAILLIALFAIIVGFYRTLRFG